MSVREEISVGKYKQGSEEVTSELGDLGVLPIDFNLGFSEGSETEGVSIKELLENPMSLVSEDLRRKGGKTLAGEERSEPIENNRPKSRGLHPVGALARTHRKQSLPIGRGLISLPCDDGQACEDPW